MRPDAVAHGVEAEADAPSNGALLSAAEPLGGLFTSWSADEDREVPLNTVDDPVGLLAADRLSSFHIVLTGVAFEGVPIPDLGVLVSGPGGNRCIGEWG